MEAWNFRGNGDFIYPLVFLSKWGKKNRGSVTNFWATKGTEEKSRYYNQFLRNEGNEGVEHSDCLEFLREWRFCLPQENFPRLQRFFAMKGIEENGDIFVGREMALAQKFK